MMDGPLDLQCKYNKLASEYSKLRSQIPVLKKAFTEEQSRYNSLSEEFKLKDQQLRIAESEADSLTFRNQQLTCRVTVLQDELDSLQNSLKKDPKLKNVDKPYFLHNFDEELSLKVAENATLIFTLNEYKEKHESEVKALKEEIDSLKLQKSFKNDEAHEISDKASQHISPSSGTNNHKSMIGETIQKALEKQLFETQHTLQEIIVERDRLKQKLKLYEENFKNEFVDLSDDCEFDQPEICTHYSTISVDKTSPIISENGSINSLPSKEMIARERAIKRCYQLRTEKLIGENMIYKSKVESFEQECLNIKSCLENELLKKRALADQCDKEKQNSVNAKEELSTTAVNYEIQLRTMSDHLAGLNDIIDEQKEQLHSLKNELLKCSSSKGKK